MTVPRIQAVQVMARLIYEDGTVGMVCAAPQEVERDELELSIPVAGEGVHALLLVQCETIQARIKQEGLDNLYAQVKQEATVRRREVEMRARTAHHRYQGQQPHDRN